LFSVPEYGGFEAGLQRCREMSKIRRRTSDIILLPLSVIRSSQITCYDDRLACVADHVCLCEMQRNLVVCRDREPASWRGRNLLQPSVVAAVFRHREER